MNIAALLPSSVLRYGVVGVVNTVAGYSVILAFEFGLGLPAQLANLIGFGAGWSIGYLLSRRYGFQSRRSHTEGLPLYALGAGLCWIVNSAVLQGASVLAFPPALAQAVAVGSYSVAFYLWNRYVVFPDDR